MWVQIRNFATIRVDFCLRGVYNYGINILKIKYTEVNYDF